MSLGKARGALLRRPCSARAVSLFSATMWRSSRWLWSQLRSPAGRRGLLYRSFRALWPALWLLGALHRRVLLRGVRIVVVVGSHGKTTTVRAIQTVLGQEVEPWSRLNERSFVARDLLMTSPRERWLVIEVAIDRPGQMSALARMLRPDVTVVTCIGDEHLTSMKSRETTRAEKSRMLEGTRAGGVAILNGDDPNVLWMNGRTPLRSVIVGRDPDSDVVLSDVSLDWPRGETITLRSAEGELEIETGLFGRHWAFPVLAAFAVGQELGIGADECASRLKQLRPTSGRLEVLPLENQAWLILDERHASLETFDAALDLLREIPARRKIAVVGDIAEPQGQRRPIIRELGSRIGAVVSHLVILGGRRASSAYAIGARAAGLGEVAVIKAGRSLEAALAGLPADLGPGDVILVKGSHPQRLARIGYRLRGHRVDCDIPTCRAATDCEHCPMLREDRRLVRISDPAAVT